jgi:hypothetical protein
VPDRLCGDQAAIAYTSPQYGSSDVVHNQQGHVPVHDLSTGSVLGWSKRATGLTAPSVVIMSRICWSLDGSQPSAQCEGGLEYLLRSPASRKRRQKGNSVSNETNLISCSVWT